MSPRRAHLLAPTLALTCGLLGCPDPEPPGDGTAPVPSASPAGEQPPADGADASPQDPLAGSVFSVADVHAIYAAEQAGEPRRSEVLREHRLLDAQGREVPARVEAYERALQRLASEDPAGWSAFVERLAAGEE